MEAFFDAWHKHDAAALRAVMDDGARFLFNGREVGPDYIVAWASKEWPAFPNARFTWNAVGGAGRWVITWTWAGDHEGPYGGIPGTGRHLERSGVAVLHANKVKLLGGTWTWDLHSFVRNVIGPEV